jgi:hypothetical protein
MKTAFGVLQLIVGSMFLMTGLWNSEHPHTLPPDLAGRLGALTGILICWIGGPLLIRSGWRRVNRMSEGR